MGGGSPVGCGEDYGDFGGGYDLVMYIWVIDSVVNQCYPNKNDQEDKNWKRTEFNGLYLRLKLNFRRMIPDGEGHQVGKLEGGVRIGSFCSFSGCGGKADATNISASELYACLACPKWLGWWGRIFMFLFWFKYVPTCSQELSQSCVTWSWRVNTLTSKR